MHSVTISSGRSFEAKLDESLLDAALRQGVALSYSCRTGRCSTCKGRVDIGQTQATCDEAGLSPDDRAQGFILTCVRQARSAVTLAIDDLGETVLPETKTLPCRIHSLERLSSDVLAVMLRLPPASPLHFLPGQYVDVIGVGGVRRSYSIANAPRDDNRIVLHIREVPSGLMSRYWFQQAKLNDLLRLRGPLGTFFLREQTDTDLVFLATGTGFAPVKAMLDELVRLPAQSQPRSTTLYWGGRHRSDLYWQPAEQSGFRFVPVLSRSDDGWLGERGYVQSTFLRNAPDLARTLVYACGSDNMIQSARELLVKAGLPTKQFHSDAFVCSASA